MFKKAEFTLGDCVNRAWKLHFNFLLMVLTISHKLCVINQNVLFCSDSNFIIGNSNELAENWFLIGLN